MAVDLFLVSPHYRIPRDVYIIAKPLHGRADFLFMFDLSIPNDPALIAALIAYHLDYCNHVLTNATD